MTPAPLTDLAFSLRQQADVSRLRAALEASGSELTTGQKADLSEDGSGLVSTLFGIDRGLERLERTGTGLALAQGEATAIQAVLGQVEGAAGTLGVELTGALGRNDATATFGLQQEAAQTLSTVFGALNTRYGGRSLFTGTGVDGPALADPAVLLADIEAIVAAAPDAATALSDIDSYFDTGGGFEANIYLGQQDDRAGTSLPDGSRTAAPPRADDPALRPVLSALASVAASSRSDFGGDVAEQAAFAEAAAVRLRDAGADVTVLRALFGQTEERIDDGLDAVGAERSALVISRNQVAGKDPFVAATEFTALEGQLQSLFTVTARLSTLSLTNFLR